MGRKKVFEQVAISDIAPEGKGFTRIDGKATFVEKTVPGDIVDVLVTRKKKDFLIGRPLKFHQYSDHRDKADCEHFGHCGGCKWQDIQYEQQLLYKQSIVEQAMSRIGKIQHPINKIIGCKKIFRYRNKLEYTFSNKRWLTNEEIKSDKVYDNKNALGFHIAGHFDKVLDINECHLQDDISNEVRLATRKYAIENGLTFFDIINQTGLLRNLTVRTSSLGEAMLIFSFFENDNKNIGGLLDHIIQLFPQINSINYVINSKKNDSIYDLEIINYHGSAYIEEKLEGITFRIRPKSFFQTNTTQTLELYGIVREMATLKGDEIVYDLYTGLGSIALFIANSCKKVVGIEQIEMAIKDAKENTSLNNIDHAYFYAGDTKDLLTDEFVEKNGNPDILIVDPPRAGLHADVVQQIVHMAPKKVIYVSCNPSTQARDINLMLAKYTVKELQPVDMFPHTHHVENVALMELR